MFWKQKTKAPLGGVISEEEEQKNCAIVKFKNILCDFSPKIREIMSLFAIPNSWENPYCDPKLVFERAYILQEKITNVETKFPNIDAHRLAFEWASMNNPYFTCIRWLELLVKENGE